MTDEEIRDFISAHRWREAVSAKKTHPHSYVVRDTVRSDSEYVRFVEFIRTHGYDGTWWGRNYRYLDIDGYTYWTMGCDTSITIILNRALLPEDQEEVPHDRENPFEFEVEPWEGDWTPYLNRRSPNP